MLDKTLPFYRIIMVRKAGTPVPKPVLPDGYTFVNYSDGDELYWAEIETSVGEFDNVEEGVKFFRENFLLFPEEVKRRTIFIQNIAGEKVATLTNWWGFAGERRDPWIHSVAVRTDYQGIGLGKAIVFEGVRRMISIEGDREIYLPTQTWSYKAIGIYLKAGFSFCREKYIGGFENECDKALPVIIGKIR